jgi:hypothetical protein
MTIPAFRCDITLKEHDCTDPLMKIQPCTLCHKRTCGWTRCAVVMQPDETMVSPWVLCLECSRLSDSDPKFKEFCTSECRKCFQKN